MSARGNRPPTLSNAFAPGSNGRGVRRSPAFAGSVPFEEQVTGPAQHFPENSALGEPKSNSMFLQFSENGRR